MYAYKMCICIIEYSHVLQICFITYRPPNGALLHIDHPQIMDVRLNWTIWNDYVMTPDDSALTWNNLKDS